MWCTKCSFQITSDSFDVHTVRSLPPVNNDCTIATHKKELPIFNSYLWWENQYFYTQSMYFWCMSDTRKHKQNPTGEQSRLFDCRELLLHDWVKTQEVQNRNKGTLERKCSMIWNPDCEYPSHQTCTCRYPGTLSTQTSFAKLQHKPSGGAFHTPNLNKH